MQGKLPVHLSRRCGAHTKNKKLSSRRPWL